ncbi:hypothetical protein ACFUJR_14845 [Streptomyces sp. NPDC057271]|uniref:hypothetical protein n=1 Tax=unclassified Streptomyces TaxID=2593676 RepID=UPI00363FFBD4
MPDYSNPATPLTANKYAWSATLVRRPQGYGPQPSHDLTGSYTPQPGATVGSLLAGVRAMYAQTHSIPAEDVLLVRYSLREK